MGFPTSYSYNLGELNWYGDYKPQIIFENGVFIRFQDDGNFVVYNSDGGVLANMGITEQAPLSKLMLHLQEDGNLVAYANGNPYWQTYTRPDRKADKSVCQQDAPYVKLLNAEGDEIWNLVDQ